ncbi:Imm1 family immunity protein [Lentzea flaviverrucosa]|uniref:Imm1 family immunity protein n=1 Tax=Lentzea flaviverrucosa TaxID=200379 RepID=UPI0014769E93|nr:Imm1 family immunity protein [Lentzea flaviverrucosa]
MAVTSSSELQELLEYLLTHEQPHPPQIVARERPRVGPYEEPDTLIKVAVAIPELQGALLFLSPQSWEPPADGDDSTGVYATRGDQSMSDSPTLYVDTDTKTPFPPNSALPLARILAALEEFRQTGERPTCVDWQESDVS